MDNKTIVENMLINFLEKLNNGDRFSREDIELNHKQIQPFIEILDTIDGFPFDMSNHEIYCFISSDRKNFDKYHILDIVETIMEYKTNDDYERDIKDILKESKLHRRDDEVYQIISSYEPYELTHCISYEMAIRNKDVQAILEKIKTLTLLSRDLFKADMLHKNDLALFYIMEIEEQRAKVLKSLDTLKIELNIDFDTSSLTEIQSELLRLITEYTALLEEDYYMIYDRKEIVPEGMEEVFKEPNHYESDRELNQYMDKAIEASIRNTYDVSPRYKDNFTFKDGYAVYQASYEDSKEYDINKIFPNFKRPMREFNQTQVAFNMSLPKDEIVKYIEKIKDDYDNKNTSYKTLNQLLYGDDVDLRVNEKLDHRKQDKYADDFFIYDYYTESNEVHEKKLELIQKKLSQFHGMKIELGRNDYNLINYDEAQIRMNTPKTKTNSNEFDDIVKSFKEHEHIIHYLETMSIIEERYKILKNAIDNKKYKKLMCHE